MQFYTCGSRRAANGIKQACIDIMKGNNPEWSEERTEAAWERVQKERYAAYQAQTGELEIVRAIEALRAEIASVHRSYKRDLVLYDAPSNAPARR